MRVSIPFVIAIIAAALVAASIIAGCGSSGDYRASLKRVNDTLVLHGFMSGIACDRYGTVWSEAIESRYKDFNTELATQREQYESQGLFARLDAGKRFADSMLKTLATPPEEMAEAHRKTMEYYGNYTELYSLAKSPEGTLISFQSKTNDLSSKHLRLTNELRILDALSPADTSGAK